MTIKPHTRRHSESFSSASARQAQLQLDFIVVGGSIGGLACAYALAAAGHHVCILERRAQDDRHSYGGIRVPPNMSKILNEWGLGEELRAKTYSCCVALFNDLDTNDNVGAIGWKEEIIAETGGDFLLMDHGDLYDMLHKVAIEAGVQIRYGATVKEVLPGKEVDGDSSESEVPSAVSITGYDSPSVVLASGEVLYADIIIGADGSHSMVRELVLGKEHDHGESHGKRLYTTQYDLEQLREEPELRWLTDAMTWHLWMGDDVSFIGHPAGRTGKYSVHAFWRDDQAPDHPCPDPSWASLYPREKFREMLKNSCPAIKRLGEIAKDDIIQAEYLVLPKTQQWFHESYTIAILGEAAHPNLPCSNQSTGMVLEDAAVLAGLFSRLRSWDQVPSLMEAYQDLRIDRAEFVAAQDLANATICWMGPGPERDHRNQVWKQNVMRGLGEWDEGAMRDQWDSISEVFAYSASDAAADWWAGWGMLAEMAKRRSGDRLEVAMTVVPSGIDIWRS